MTMSWTASLPTALLLVATFIGCAGANRLYCRADEYEIESSPYPESMDVFASCGQVISARADSRHAGFHQDCQRWMGQYNDQQTNYNLRYHVESCLEDKPNHKVTYNASICCKDTTIKIRCFECYNYSDFGDCLYTRDAVECDGEDQVCKTVVHYVDRNATGHVQNTVRSTFCAPRDSCEAEKEAETTQCSDWSGAEAPFSCTHCCSDSFCNYYQGAIPQLQFIGSNPCMSNPCQNGGICSSNPLKCICAEGYTGQFCESEIDDACFPNPCLHDGRCSPEGRHHFSCQCRTGQYGDTCEKQYEYCTSNTNCQNGGTCYYHDTHGDRCLCAPGFMGERCEMTTLKCFNPRALRIGANVTHRNTNCSKLAQRMQTKISMSVQYCKGYMRKEYKNAAVYKDGVHGPKIDLEAVSFESCTPHNSYSLVTNAFCCASCFSLPCQNNGWCEQLEDGDYVCKCRAGWYGKNCDLKAHICMVSGDPHFFMFDGQAFPFQGYGDFIFAENQSPPFDNYQVIGTLEAVGHVSYVKAVTVHACDHTVELLRGEHHPRIVVDGVEITDVYNKYEKDCITITMDGRVARLETKFNLVVGFDGRITAYVQVSDKMQGHANGLCGRFDEDQTNDFTGRDGHDYGGDSVSQDDIDDFGVTWAVSPDAGVAVSPDVDCEKPNIKTLQERHCDRYLASGGVFHDCIQAMHANRRLMVEAPIKACGLDVCMNKDEPHEAACKYMESLAAMCESIEPVQDWRDETNCPMECPEPLVYFHDGNACMATCENPRAEKHCTTQNKDVCKCPDGLVLHMGECVEPATCGCFKDGRQYSVGDSWLSADCGKLLSCVECTDCKYDVGTMKEVDFVCPDTHKCQKTLFGGEERGECVSILQCPEGATYENPAPYKSACTHMSIKWWSYKNFQSEGCVCPGDQKYRDDGSCVHVGDCYCGIGNDRRMALEEWEVNVPTTITYQCKDGEVKEIRRTIDKRQECLTDCDKVVVTLDYRVIDSSTEPITVTAGLDYNFRATVNTKADSIKLLKTVAGIPEEIECNDVLECARLVSFTMEDGALGASYLVAIITHGNVRTTVTVPIYVEGAYVDCR